MLLAERSLVTMLASLKGIFRINVREKMVWGVVINSLLLAYSKSSGLLGAEKKPRTLNFSQISFIVKEFSEI